MPSEELDVESNFRSQTWEEARAVLDNMFHRIFDLLKANPALHALVDGRESEPQHKPGDFAVDYRDGNIKLKMSDGKNLLEIGLSALGGTVSAAQHGAQPSEVVPGGALMHPVVTLAGGGTPGFMSVADKTKLNGLSNATPSSTTPASVSTAAAAIGADTEYARADHKHQALTKAPVNIGTGNAIGSGPELARFDHVHDHGDLGGGTLHAAVVAGGANGFMTGADKTKLNLYDGYVAAGTMPTPALGHMVLWYDTGGLGLYIVGTGGSGTKKTNIMT